MNASRVPDPHDPTKEASECYKTIAQLTAALNAATEAGNEVVVGEITGWIEECAHYIANNEEIMEDRKKGNKPKAQANLEAVMSSLDKPKQKKAQAVTSGNVVGFGTAVASSASTSDGSDVGSQEETME